MTHYISVEPMNMTAKRRQIIRKLFIRGAETTLQGLSSEYCECDEKEFKNNYGFSSKDAITALKALIYQYR